MISVLWLQSLSQSNCVSIMLLSCLSHPPLNVFLYLCYIAIFRPIHFRGRGGLLCPTPNAPDGPDCSDEPSDHSSSSAWMPGPLPQMTQTSLPRPPPVVTRALQRRRKPHSSWYMSSKHVSEDCAPCTFVSLAKKVTYCAWHQHLFIQTVCFVVPTLILKQEKQEFFLRKNGAVGWFLSLPRHALVREAKEVALIVCCACFTKLSGLQKLGETHITVVNLDSQQAETLGNEHKVELSDLISLQHCFCWRLMAAKWFLLITNFEWGFLRSGTEPVSLWLSISH